MTSIKFQVEKSNTHSRHFRPTAHVSIYNHGWGYDNLPVQSSYIYDYQTFDELPMEKRYALILGGSASMLGTNVIEEMKTLMNNPEELQKLWESMVDKATIVKGDREEAKQWTNPEKWMEEDTIAKEKARIEDRIKRDASTDYSRENPKKRFGDFLEFKHDVVDIIKSTGIPKAVPTYTGSSDKTYGYVVKGTTHKGDVRIYFTYPRRRSETMTPEERRQKARADLVTIKEALLEDYPEMLYNEENGTIVLFMKNRYPRRTA